uniref:Trehalase n=1 Tax=Salix viminalis TaxID=40686 RepID=A0A6N2K6I4_SALVM
MERQSTTDLTDRSRKTLFFSLSYYCLWQQCLLRTRNCSGTDTVVATTPLVTFLVSVQETALRTFGEENFDPKRYVDLSLKSNLSKTQKAFDGLPRSGENGTVSVEDLKVFIATYFDDAGDDLVYYDPEDFFPEPEGFLPKVKNPEVRSWALEVHALWKNLSRKVSDGVLEHSELHTMLPLPEACCCAWSSVLERFIIGILIGGLLASKMYETAKAIVTNLIFHVNTYGYVLNGGRAYYTNRSQPPLLSAMVYEIYNRTCDVELVRKALPALLEEHAFWNSEIHKVTIQDAQGSQSQLSAYYAMWNKPRPESSRRDKEYASKFLDNSEKQQFYREVASAAESGWDFSTRWMRNTSEFSSIVYESILPVDLNVYILKMEQDIAFFANVLGHKSTMESFLEAAEARKNAINSVFWNDEMGQWLDYRLANGPICKESETWQACNQNQNAYASNFIPLWIDLFHSDAALVEKVMRSFHSSGLVHSAGIATSLINSGHQWDFPNGWAPLQHMIVEGFLRSGLKEARSLAEDIAVRWIKTNYVGYKKTGAMHEKYDVQKCGEFGGGGFYKPPTGFGWSNGVVLTFLEEFGWPEDQSIVTVTLTKSLSPKCSVRGPAVASTPLVTFLERVQETALGTFGEQDFDPKLYVDLSLKSNLSKTQKAFDELPRSGENGTVTVKDLKVFIATYFDDAGDDLVYYDPEDFLPEPEGFLPKVKNPEVRSWALEVHALWKNLSRKVSDEVLEHSELHTLLPLPEAVVVPGSRFREVYYWDSYWVIRGLLASKMYTTAKAIVTNLIFLVDTYGYVLNVQPPLLSAMVYEIYNRTCDVELVRKALPAFVEEHAFWNSEIHKVTIQDAQGSNHNLSRYYAMWNKPRPESSTIDKGSASKFSGNSKKQQFYREVASAAESGWDFSTRWMRNTSEFSTLSTTSILPVDLNVYILKMEQNIAFFANVLGHKSTMESFLEAAEARKNAINSVFWNEEMGQWLDYRLANGPICKVLSSCICCFGGECHEKFTKFRPGSCCRNCHFFNKFRTTMNRDFPNGWAPLQHMIVEGLLRSGVKEARSLAEDIAVRWIKTNYIGYKKTGAMHEKYDVQKCGAFGGGGEYIPQTGFGWSNGVVLTFLRRVWMA